MAVANQEELAGASIEQITEMALKKINEDEGAGDETDPMLEDDTKASEDIDASATEGKKDVEQAASGQPEGEVSKKSDKEMNFAALRTKVQKTEAELAAAQEEIKKLSERNTFKAELPEDHAQKMESISNDLIAIGRSFQDGDLTWDEYQHKLRETTAVREALVEESILSKISERMKVQAEADKAANATASWESTVGKFIDAKPDGVDYKGDEAKNRDLNVYVKALASDTDNADKDFDWFLKEAHALVKAKHRIAGTGVAKPEIKDETPSSSKPFQTLSDVPGGVLAGKSESENLEDMSGAALANRFMNDPGGIDKLLASLG